jgi:hypothetical protein
MVDVSLRVGDSPPRCRKLRPDLATANPPGDGERAGAAAPAFEAMPQGSGVYDCAAVCKTADNGGAPSQSVAPRRVRAGAAGRAVGWTAPNSP